VSALRSGRHPFSAFRAERADVLAWARENLAILRGPNLYQVSPAAAQKVNPPFQLLSHIFFWGWVVLGLQLCFRGFDSAARPQWGEMKRRTLPLGIVYGLWLLSLRLA
jgi:hypothetical protein